MECEEVQQIKQQLGLLNQNNVISQDLFRMLVAKEFLKKSILQWNV